jgi:hypothetical protein
MSTETLLTEAAASTETTAATTAETSASTTQAAESIAATTTEAKPGEAATTTDPEAKPKEGETKATDAKTGAPEAYTDFTAPEGVTLDPVMVTDLKAVAKEFDLSQDKAQKLVDLGVKMQQRSAEAWVAQQEAWVNSVKTDKDIGGEKLAENMAVAQKAMTAYATPEFRAFLDQTGMGNHPEMIKAFHRIGKSISEDGFVPGGKNTGVQRTAADRLYGNSKTA